MKTIHSSPTLYSTTKRGLAKMWMGHIVTDGTDFYLSSESWQELADGGESKHNEAKPYLVRPKNIGKKNETTPKEQAFLEFESMVKKQNDKGYAEKGKNAAKVLPRPMLAQKYKERKHKISWPAYVQRKLDGNRMLFDGEYAQSRGGKQILPEVVQHLEFDTDGYILDGELILDGNQSLQKTMKAIKKYYSDLSPRLEYHVYDIVLEDTPFSERWRILKSLSGSFPKNVKLVETYPVHAEDEMIAYHKQFVLEGFEGTIIRNMNGVYEVNQRSNDLQKYKDFQDSEYLIVGVESGNGLYSGCAILICETDDGKQFKSNPEGTIEYKRELYQQRSSLIGKYLTVRYFSLSDEGIPLMNVGVALRDVDSF